MWISLFTIVLTLAFGFAVGAVILESYGEKVRRYGRRPGHNLRMAARYLRATTRS